MLANPAASRMTASGWRRSSIDPISMTRGAATSDASSTPMTATDFVTPPAVRSRATDW